MARTILIAAVLLLAGCKDPSIEEAVKRHVAYRQRLASETMRLNLIDQSDEIDNFIGGLDGVTRQQGAMVFFAVFEGCPEAPLQRQFGIARRVAANGILLEDDALRDLAFVCGQMSQVDPSKTDDSCVNMGLMVYQMFQRYTRSVPDDRYIRAAKQLVKSNAMSPEKAMGMAIEIARTSNDPETLEAYAYTVTTGKPWPKGQ